MWISEKSSSREKSKSDTKYVPGLTKQGESKTVRVQVNLQDLGNEEIKGIQGQITVLKVMGSKNSDFYSQWQEATAKFWWGCDVIF